MTEQTFRMKLKRLAKDLTVGVGACVKRERGRDARHRRQAG